MEWRAGKIVKAIVTSKYEKSVTIKYLKKRVQLKIGKGKSVSLDVDLKIAKNKWSEF
jgi:hypothetical protein